MRKLTAIFLIALVEQVHVKELRAEHITNAPHDMADNLVDEIVDQVVDRALEIQLVPRRVLKRTTSVVTLPRNPSSISALPFWQAFRKDLLPRRKAARRTAQVQAFSVQPEDIEYWAQEGVSAVLAYVVATAFKNQFIMTGGRTAPEEIRGSEEIMATKSHGTCPAPVQSNLRWGCNRKVADKICAFNRHGAEYAGYFLGTSFLKEEPNSQPVYFYDSVTGKPLFVAPVGRTWDEFVKESKVHGWPSFRDEEVVKENVRVLKNGEAVSIDGTHLGHNLPDKSGNRYCINLVSVAGRPRTDIEIIKAE